MFLFLNWFYGFWWHLMAPLNRCWYAWTLMGCQLVHNRGRVWQNKSLKDDLKAQTPKTQFWTTKKGTDCMNIYHWKYFVRLTQYSTLGHCFFWRLAISRAHATDAILSHFLPTCHLFDTINRITCHKAFMRVKNMSLRWWENNVGDCGWCVSASSARYPPLLCFRDKVKNKERRERLTGGRQTAAKWKKGLIWATLSLLVKAGKKKRKGKRRQKRKKGLIWATLSL